ncbi:MAG: hypothetical protein HN509_07335, partial [Halobacteriovoraceae bacterium]|nr:hypothetical protein [Halobacteriovoraceae bacterium]
MKLIYLIAIFLVASCAGYKTQFDSQSKTIEGQFWDDFEHYCLNPNMSAYDNGQYGKDTYFRNSSPADREEFKASYRAKVGKSKQIKSRYNLAGPAAPPLASLSGDNRLTHEIKRTGTFETYRSNLITLDKRCYKKGNLNRCLGHLYSRKMSYPYKVTCRMGYKKMAKSDEEGRMAFVEEFSKRYGPQAIEVGKVISSRTWASSKWDDALVILMRDNLSVFIIGFDEKYKTDVQLLTYSDSFPITVEKIMGQKEVLDLTPMGIAHVKGNMKATLRYFNRI